MILTHETLIEIRDRMSQIITEDSERLTRNLWWDKVARQFQSQGRREKIAWLVESASLEYSSAPHGGGSIAFDEIDQLWTEFTNKVANAGLIVKKEDFEDVDGNGFDVLTHWTKQVTAQAVYWPQKVIADVIKANPQTYDGLALFHASGHFVNGRNNRNGVFANLFTGASSGAYPGAAPIGGADETALANLAKVVAYIHGLKAASGFSRNLRAKRLFVPPALMPAASKILNAKFIDATDVQGLTSYLGMVPIECPELGAAQGGSDTTYYVGVEEPATDGLGGVVYSEREAFSIQYHGPETDAELERVRQLQWTTQGRNVAHPGHPYLLFRVDAT